MSCMKWTCRSFFNILLWSRYSILFMRVSTQSVLHLWAWVRPSSAPLKWKQRAWRASMKGSSRTWSTSETPVVRSRPVSNTTSGSKASSKDSKMKCCSPPSSVLFWFTLAFRSIWTWMRLSVKSSKSSERRSAENPPSSLMLQVQRKPNTVIPTFHFTLLCKTVSACSTW